MNCFNIREVEALLKGRFFPDLINTHDHRILLNNTTLGLRYQVSNLETISHNILLFQRYGLQSTNGNRLFTFQKLPITTYNKYEFLELPSSLISFFNLLKGYVFTLPFDIITSILDISLLQLALLQPVRVPAPDARRGFCSNMSMSHYASHFLKSELERQVLLFFTILDLSQFGLRFQT